MDFNEKSELDWILCRMYSYNTKLVENFLPDEAAAYIYRLCMMYFILMYDEVYLSFFLFLLFVNYVFFL